MSILNTENLGLSFGSFDLFRGISVSIANDSKIGLVGPNGIGKTSLLLIMAGINQPTSGKVHLARGRRMGYLRQEAVDAFADRENTVYSEMLSVFSDLLEKQKYLSELETQMAEDFSDSLLEKYGACQEEFEKMGGYDYDLRIQQTLEGLGLGKNYWHMPLRHLSGGQKTRALLARLLLEKPDLLMLDEPTNHLDIDAVEWLEHTLEDWDGAVLIVSHDRFFLDNTVNTIWEMSRSGIEDYSGNYSAYLLQRQERWEYYQRVFTEEKTRLLNEVDFIQRNWVRASTHARALGLLRRLTRDLAIVDQFGILSLRSGKKWSEYDLHADRPLDVIDAIRKVNAISMTSKRPPNIRPRLPAGQISGTIIIQAADLKVGYEENNPLFSISSLELRRGECAALIGPNGSGKTTFLKTLLEQMPPLSGSLRLGASLKIGYFAQAHDHLDPAHTVIDELLEHKKVDDEVARNHLAQFSFHGDDIYKVISSLSGGERARLALAILSLEETNFLLLDEPTNHLDIPAREALQEVLNNYTGTILLVSHDRFLINGLATQIWELRNNRLEIFKGTYREYILRRSAPTSLKKPGKLLITARPLVRDNSKQTRQRELDLTRLEGLIHEQEVSIQRLSSDLQQAGSKSSLGKIQDLSWKISQAQAELERLMGEWEKLVA